jgi:hypothetical protein
MMNRTALFIVLTTRLAAQEAADPNKAVVRGSLLDPQPAHIGENYDSSVTIACEAQTPTAQKTPTGQYQFKVRPGLCTITGQARHFYEARRAPFRLHEGDDITIDLFPRLHLSGIATEVAEKGFVDHYEYLPRPRYKEFQTITRFPALLEYRSKNFFSGWHSYCTLTWDHYTIRAERMKYDAPRRTIEMTQPKQDRALGREDND